MNWRKRWIGQYQLIETANTWIVKIRDAPWYITQENVPGGYQVLLRGLDGKLRDFPTIAAALAFAEENTA